MADAMAAFAAELHITFTLSSIDQIRNRTPSIACGLSRKNTPTCRAGFRFERGNCMNVPRRALSRLSETRRKKAVGIFACEPFAAPGQRGNREYFAKCVVRGTGDAERRSKSIRG